MSDTPIFVYGTLRPNMGNGGWWTGIATPHHDGNAFAVIADEGRIEALDKDRYGR